jgi:hypothetical protein
MKLEISSTLTQEDWNALQMSTLDTEGILVTRKLQRSPPPRDFLLDSFSRGFSGEPRMLLAGTKPNPPASAPGRPKNAGFEVTFNGWF